MTTHRVRLLSFERTVIAIGEIVARQAPVATPDAAASAAIGEFVLATHASTPDYLRRGLHVLTLVFDASTVPRWGRPFHRLDPALQARHMARWEASRFGFCSGLIAFYRSFTIFGLYTPKVEAIGELPPVSQRQPVRLAHG